MTFKNKLFIPLAAFALSMGACKKDYLVKSPTDAVSDEAIFLTTTNAMAALNGIHRSMFLQYFNQDQGGQGSVNLNVDYMGEDLVNTVSVTAYGNYKWINHRTAITASSTNNFVYSFYYRIIANANAIINNIDKATGSIADKNQIRAEALTYRAWAHFALVQLFAIRYDANGNNTQLGVPLITATVTANTPGQPRATVEAVYTQVNADLDAAIAAYANATPRQFKSHFNINVTKGIKARVALTQGKWAIAAQNASEAASGFNLMTNAQYLAGFNSISNPEWMWGTYQQEDQTTYFYSFFAYMGTFNSTANRTNPKRINSVLYDKIAAADVRKGLWDPTGKNTAFPVPAGGVRSTYMQRKFTNAGTTSVGDVVNMRVAEMYLIEAEARANAGETSKAQTVLNTLASARNPSYVLSTNTGQALLDEIYIQRRIELWGEGFRFFDLKRLNLPLDRTGGNATVAIANTLSVPAGGPIWQWAFPQDEINSNPNLGGQNP
ncbi:RagB/SusD family nutrient uptake outer membrane protein [Pedobacter sp. PAMC26386]|nr:RagB/SusD family nutrient uptake outer membrane protein [Pedobacter sp. PAMC26386]